MRYVVGGVLGFTTVATIVVACGARSDLELGPDLSEGGSTPDAGPPDAPLDAPLDVPEDVPEDVEEDVYVPPECSGPEVTYIYAVTDANELWAYKPQSNGLELKGELQCPTASSPFSMAVSRDGVAHVVYQSGELFAVDILDASCQPTPYVVPPPDAPFFLYGMGYAANPDDGGETLYIADITFDNPSAGLAKLDTESYQVSFIGPFSENPANAIELTPTGLDGALFGYFLYTQQPGGQLVEIDTNNGDIVSSKFINAGNGGGSLAIAWWGGDFYIFNGAIITRHDPVAEQTIELDLKFPNNVVGAGVSTCAPGALD